ncbi:hypothetical protein CONLIGDRAFT_667393 [Coniochaeta ligniaria NRRL 30616]|uniref:Uncharacterized protein n=1 Tax=Coniochaeta ligniaria NRRL 30616 TaxID=1408157 RepID=A0A1J7JUQ9_9PEZI|nr:hypothetical protein CONLIGDRAFT_667393 [Coniochaeta ligniaria NRRL 30616]
MPTFTFTISGEGSNEDIAAIINAASGATGCRLNFAFPAPTLDEISALTSALARTRPAGVLNYDLQFKGTPPPPDRAVLVEDNQLADVNNARGLGVRDAFDGGLGGGAVVDDEVGDHRGPVARDGPGGGFGGRGALGDEVEDPRGPRAHGGFGARGGLEFGARGDPAARGGYVARGTGGDLAEASGSSESVARPASKKRTRSPVGAENEPSIARYTFPQAALADTSGREALMREMQAARAAGHGRRRRARQLGGGGGGGGGGPSTSGGGPSTSGGGPSTSGGGPSTCGVGPRGHGGERGS